MGAVCVREPGSRRAAPLAEFLEDLPERIADSGVDVDALSFLSRAESEFEANWKICTENFLECYHCPVAHPGFSAVMDVSPDSYLLETSRWRAAQYSPPKPEPRGSYDPAGEVEQGQFHFLFPNTVVNVMPGRPNISIGPIVPLAPELTYRFLDYLAAPDAGEAWLEEMLAFDAQVGAEDRQLVERVQAGVRSGVLEEGRLMPESERLVEHFQALVVEALA
jgi:choline monooxygenase